VQSKFSDYVAEMMLIDLNRDSTQNTISEETPL
jgi:hypothetical protein